MINIYLDVDGVLNALSSGAPRNNTHWFGDWGSKRIEGFPILWSKELIEEINTLTERDDITVKWLTTWGDLAALSLSPKIGLKGENWEFLVSEDMLDPYRWWKLFKIQEDIEKTNPEKVIWIDDDIPFERNAKEWVTTLATPIHAVHPRSEHGLSRYQWNGIIDFIS